MDTAETVYYIVSFCHLEPAEIVGPDENGGDVSYWDYRQEPTEPKVFCSSDDALFWAHAQIELSEGMAKATISEVEPGNAPVHLATWDCNEQRWFVGLE